MIRAWENGELFSTMAPRITKINPDSRMTWNKRLMFERVPGLSWGTLTKF